MNKEIAHIRETVMSMIDTIDEVNRQELNDVGDRDRLINLVLERDELLTKLYLYFDKQLYFEDKYEK